MTDDVTPTTIDREFIPKDRADKWHIVLGENGSSGYDFLLLIENQKTKVSYQIEVGIMEDERLCGQITPDDADVGPDALVLFDMTPEIARVSGNHGGAKLLISVNDSSGPTVVEDPDLRNRAVSIDPMSTFEDGFPVIPKPLRVRPKVWLRRQYHPPVGVNEALD